MTSRARQGIAIVAAALVLVYVSMAGLTEIRSFAVLPSSLGWLAAAAFACGFLMALIVEGGAWQIAASSVLAVLVFAGLWNVIFWSFLGDYASFLELSISNPFIYQVVPQCALILLTTAPMGLLGVIAATVVVPGEYRP